MGEHEKEFQAIKFLVDYFNSLTLEQEFQPMVETLDLESDLQLGIDTE